MTTVVMSAPWHNYPKSLSIRLSTETNYKAIISIQSGPVRTHTMGNPTMVMRYQDQHGIIKAIERCSLQAIFGPDVGSTGDLLPKRPDTSLVVPLKPSRDSVSRPIEKRVYSNKTSFISAEPDIDTSLLPADSTDEDGNVFSDLITNDDIMPVLVTNQESNIPSACSTEPDIVPPSSTREYGMTPFQQSRYLGRVPLEEWGHKVSRPARTSLSVSLANRLPFI